MTAINLLMFFIFLLIIRNIVLGVLAWRQSRKWKGVEQKEVTRRFFAEARKQLLGLVNSNELKPNSTTFRFFYYLDTFVMRSPNDYQRISSLLLRNLVDETSVSGVVEQLISEQPTWTESVKSMVRKQSQSLNHLMVSHSFILRNVYRFSLVLYPVLKLVISTVDIWEKLKTKVAERDKGFVHNVYRSEKTLEGLVST